MAVCALVGAGPFNAECFRTQWTAGAFACVVAVDGGLAALEAVGCTPNVALGDFDSLGYVPEGLSAEVEVFQYPTHKDESDMELALRLACERGFGEAVVYGAIGGRLDHTLANLQLLAAYSEQGLRVTAIDLPETESDRGRSRCQVGTESDRGRSRCQVGTALTFLTGPAQLELESDRGRSRCQVGTALTFLTGPAQVELEPHPGETVSVFSLSDESHGVTETGLAYPLDHVTLTNRTTRGLSNEFTEAPATISVASGTLVVFHPLF